MTVFPDRAVVFSVLLHAALFGVTAINMDWQPPRRSQGTPVVTIKATVVDSEQIDQQRRELEEQLERQQQEQADREREQREAEERIAEEKRQAEDEARRIQEEEVQRRQEAEQAVIRKREEEEARRREKEAVAAEIKRKEEALRQRQAREAAAEEAERVRREEIERQRAAEAERERVAEEKRVAVAKQRADERRARERREQDAREDQLQAMLATESQRRTAVDSGLLDDYVALLLQKIRRNWNRPPSTPDDMECLVRVQQIPGGEVVSVEPLDCRVEAAVWGSVERAILKSSPLPPPADPTLFERTLEILFVPNE